MLVAQILFISRPLPPLTYRVPVEMQEVRAGALVCVPLKNQRVWGVVCCVYSEPNPSPNLKPLLQVHLVDPDYALFIERLARHHVIAPSALYRRLSSLLAHAKKTPPALSRANTEIVSLMPPLNSAQHAVYLSLIETYEGDRKPILLHGITGSGKTLIYLAFIEHVYRVGKSCLFLAPEISIAQAFAHAARQYIPHVPLFELHAAIASKTRLGCLEHLTSGHAALYVGVQIPLLLPIQKLDLCILDEEHDPGYQEKNPPFIHARDAALIRYGCSKMQLLLGSATPSITSMYHAQMGHYRLLKLHERHHSSWPAPCEYVTIETQKDTWISPELEAGIRETLADGNQVLLFVNRRGSHCFARCTKCKTVFSCPTCALACTVHHNHILKCHHCLYERQIPEYCACGSPKHRIERRGIGTQSIVQRIEELFPQARIARADLDSLKDTKEWPQTAQRMLDHELDILVGTQMITKGHHFPCLALVGALWGDMHLNTPYYLSYEHTIQQLIQAAGRAGREDIPGRVIIQTVATHEKFTAFLDEKNYDDFYAYELELRQTLMQPPFCKRAHLIVVSQNEEQVHIDSARLLELLTQPTTCVVQGPARPLHYQCNGIFSLLFVLKAASYKPLQHLARACFELKLASRVLYIPNPQRQSW